MPPGTIEDVTVLGGDIGIRAQGSQYTMRGLTFRGQRTAAIQVAGDVWTFAFASIVASGVPVFLAVVRQPPSLSRPRLPSSIPRPAATWCMACHDSWWSALMQDTRGGQR